MQTEQHNRTEMPVTILGRKMVLVSNSDTMQETTSLIQHAKNMRATLNSCNNCKFFWVGVTALDISFLLNHFTDWLSTTDADWVCGLVVWLFLFGMTAVTFTVWRKFN